MAKVNNTEGLRLYDTNDTTHNDDPLWDNWFEMASYFEPECDKEDDDDEACEPLNSSAEGEIDGDVEIDICEQFPINNKAQSTMCANRRKLTYRYKNRVRRKALICMDGYDKRMKEDQWNAHFCKKRGGHTVKFPKFLCAKAERLYKRATKMKLVPELT